MKPRKTIFMPRRRVGVEGPKRLVVEATYRRKAAAQVALIGMRRACELRLGSIDLEAVPLRFPSCRTHLVQVCNVLRPPFRPPSVSTDHDGYLAVGRLCDELRHQHATFALDKLLEPGARLIYRLPARSVSEPDFTATGKFAEHISPSGDHRSGGSECEQRSDRRNAGFVHFCILWTKGAPILRSAYQSKNSSDQTR